MNIDYFSMNIFFCTIRFVQICTTPYLSGILLNFNSHINMGNINVFTLVYYQREDTIIYGATFLCLDSNEYKTALNTLDHTRSQCGSKTFFKINSFFKIRAVLHPM